MPKLILSYRLWEEDGKTLFQVTGMDEAFRGKGKLFERKGLTVVSNLYPSVCVSSLYLRGEKDAQDLCVDPTYDTLEGYPSRKRIIKTLNAWARSLNPAIPKETDFTKTEFAYYYAEDDKPFSGKVDNIKVANYCMEESEIRIIASEINDKPKCHWCGSDMIVADYHNVYLICTNVDCEARSPNATTEADAIAKHNQIKR